MKLKGKNIGDFQHWQVTLVTFISQKTEAHCMNQKICYLLGALRDGTFDVRQGKNYELRIYQDDGKWLDFVSKILEQNFGLKPHKIGKLLRLSNKKVVGKILKISEYVKPQKMWFTPSCIKGSSQEKIWWYVSGFWDAEGGLPENPTMQTQNYVSFDQKNKESLEFVRNFLISDGFRPTNLTYTGNVWQFRLTRKESVRKFIERIHCFHGGKLARLKKLYACVP